MLNRYKNLLLGSFLVTAVCGLSACGGSSSDGVSLQKFDVTGDWTGNISQHNRQALVPVSINLAGGASLTGTIEVSGHTCIADGNLTGTAAANPAGTQGDNVLTPGIQENSNQGTVTLAYTLDGATGGVTAVTFTAGSPGSGYTSIPTVIFADPLDPGGKRAEGIAQVGGVTGGTSGALESIEVLPGGEGYTSIPTVTIADPPAGGTTATAVARLGGAMQVSGTNQAAAGNGYSSAPTVTISAPASSGGVTATAVAVLGEPGRVVSIACTGGTGYVQATTTITVNAPDVSGGVRAEANPIVSATGVMVGAVVTNHGSGYNIVPGVTLTGGNGDGSCTSDALEGGDAGQVVDIDITNPGSGYILTPSITITGGGGSGAEFTPTMTTAGDAGEVVWIDLVEPGSGYIEEPSITITGGGGSGARATAELRGVPTEAGEITAVIITDPGSGYLANDPPMVTFSGGGGAGARAFGTVTAASSGEMSFNLSGTSDQLSGHFSGTWGHSSESCRVNTNGVISLNRS